jgi:hypothetical protein
MVRRRGAAAFRWALLGVMVCGSVVFGAPAADAAPRQAGTLCVPTEVGPCIPLPIALPIFGGSGGGHLFDHDGTEVATGTKTYRAWCIELDYCPQPAPLNPWHSPGAVVWDYPYTLPLPTLVGGAYPTDPNHELFKFDKAADALNAHTIAALGGSELLAAVFVMMHDERGTDPDAQVDYQTALTDTFRRSRFNPVSIEAWTQFNVTHLDGQTKPLFSWVWYPGLQASFSLVNNTGTYPQLILNVTYDAFGGGPAGSQSIVWALDPDVVLSQIHQVGLTLDWTSTGSCYSSACGGAGMVPTLVFDGEEIAGSGTFNARTSDLMMAINLCCEYGATINQYSNWRLLDIRSGSNVALASEIIPHFAPAIGSTEAGLDASLPNPADDPTEIVPAPGPTPWDLPDPVVSPDPSPTEEPATGWDITTLGSTILDGLTWVGTGITNAIDGLAATIASGIQWLGDIFGMWIRWLAEQLLAMLQVLANLLYGIVALLGQAVDLLAQVLWAVAQIPGLLADLATALATLPELIATAVATALATLLEELFVPTDTTVITTTITDHDDRFPFSWTPVLAEFADSLPSMGTGCPPSIVVPSPAGGTLFTARLPSATGSGCPGTGPGGARTSDDETIGELWGWRARLRALALALVGLSVVLRVLRSVPFGDKPSALAPAVGG